jgi:hypothetical protein
MNGLSIVTGAVSGTHSVEQQRNLPQINSMKNIRDIEGTLTSKNKNSAASSLKGA